MVTLPKWSALTVTGNPVTREQAAEILIRTNSWYGCNDRKWEAAVWQSIGLEKETGYGLSYEERKEVNLGLLTLDYLVNDRIMSCWIGGTKGWCDWNGNIRTRNYNIGKWPTVEEVQIEWEVIAQTFPYLDLRAVLWSQEAGQPENDPLVEFIVREGKVEVSENPTHPVLEPEYTFSDGYDYRAERGCSLETLHWAIDLTRKAIRTT